MKTLLEKLERIRKELGSDKVFDVIGRLFEGRQHQGVHGAGGHVRGGADAACRALEGTLTKEQVEALEAQRAAALRRRRRREGVPRRRAGEARPRRLAAAAARLRPPVRREVGPAAGARDRRRPRTGRSPSPRTKPGALDFLWNLLETYPPSRRQRLTVRKPKDADDVAVPPPRRAGLRPAAGPRLRDGSPTPPCRGGVFVDPTASEPVPVPPGGRLGLAARPIPRTRRWRGPRSWSTAWSGCGRHEDGTGRAVPGRAPAAAQGRARHPGVGD